MREDDRWCRDFNLIYSKYNCRDVSFIILCVVGMPKPKKCSTREQRANNPACKTSGAKSWKMSHHTSDEAGDSGTGGGGYHFKLSGSNPLNWWDQVKKGANKYWNNSHDMRAIRKFHESGWDRPDHAISHGVGHATSRGLKDFQRERLMAGTAGFQVGGVDQRLISANASPDQRVHGAIATGRGLYHMARGDRSSNQLGHFSNTQGAGEAEYTIPATIARGTGLPVPHEPEGKMSFDVRDPGKSKIELGMGADKLEVPMQDLPKAAGQSFTKVGRTAAPLVKPVKKAGKKIKKFFH